MNLAQTLEQCPSLPLAQPKRVRRLETGALLRAAAPIDTSDPVDAILAEATCTLGVALTALEAMGATSKGELSDLFTLLFAMQSRLTVAREFRDNEALIEASAENDVADAPSPTSSSRPSHPVDATEVRLGPSERA